MEMLAIEEVVIHPRVIDEWRARGQEKFLIRREKKKKIPWLFSFPFKPARHLRRGEGRLETSQCLGYLQVVAVPDVLFRGGGGGGGEGVSFQELGYVMLIMIVSKI